MSFFNSRLRLKTGVVLNLLSLAFIVLSWSTGSYTKTKLGLIITCLFALLVLMYTYYYSFWQTGLWKFTHKIVPMLDEREYAVNNRALRFSYNVFTIIVLALLMYYALTKTLPHMVPVAGLIYFSHILPAVYLGWKR